MNIFNAHEYLSLLAYEVFLVLKSLWVENNVLHLEGLSDISVSAFCWKNSVIISVSLTLTSAVEYRYEKKTNSTGLLTRFYWHLQSWCFSSCSCTSELTMLNVTSVLALNTILRHFISHHLVQNLPKHLFKLLISKRHNSYGIFCIECPPEICLRFGCKRKVSYFVIYFKWVNNILVTYKKENCQNIIVYI